MISFIQSSCRDVSNPIPRGLLSSKAEKSRMERQRSFSLKPTRLLVFSFAISSSLLFCFFFSFWLFTDPPSNFRETHLQFNLSSLSVYLTTKKAQTFTSFSGNFTVNKWGNAILAHTHLRTSTNSSSGRSVVSDVEMVVRLKNESEAFVERKRVSEAKVTSLAGSPVRKSSNSSEKIKLSVVKRKIKRNKSSQCDVFNGRWVYDESYPLPIVPAPLLMKVLTAKLMGDWIEIS